MNTLLRRSLFSVYKNAKISCRTFAVDNKISEKINSLVTSNKVVVFMKGEPNMPRCGFSNAVVQILRMHGVEYTHVDVMENEDMRQGVKEFSNWPTIPQVFIKGEFVGGCDILLQMHQSGELIDELKKVGITSALLSSAIPGADDGSDDLKKMK